MSLFTLYLLAVLPNIGSMFKLFAFFSGIAVVSLVVFYLIAKVDKAYPDEKTEKSVLRCLKLAVYTFFICNMLFVLIPSRQDLYFIMGGYYVTNNEELKKLPDNVLGAVNSFLEDVKPEKHKEENKTEGKGI